MFFLSPSAVSLKHSAAYHGENKEEKEGVFQQDVKKIPYAG
jgi:hypothetical protein